MIMYVIWREVSFIVYGNYGRSIVSLHRNLKRAQFLTKEVRGIVYIPASPK